MPTGTDADLLDPGTGKTSRTRVDLQDNFSEVKDKFNTLSLDVDELDSDVGRRVDLVTDLKNDLVTAINELDSDINGPGGGVPANDMNVVSTNIVDAINEIERVFDASAGEIIYPTGASYETQTRLLIDTTAGNDVQVNVGNDFNVDAANNILLDAGGTQITYKDGTTNRFVYTLGASNVVAVTGNYDLDVAGNINLDASTGSITFQDAGSNAIVYSLDPTGTNTVTVTGNYEVDASGSITLDADGGDDIIFQGSGTERLRFNVDAATIIDHTGTSLEIQNDGDLLLDPAGDINMDVGGEQVRLRNGSAASRFVFNLDATPQLDVTGEFTLAGDNTVTQSSVGNFELAATSGGTITLDAEGDIILDANGSDITFQDAASTFGSVKNVSGQVSLRSGGTPTEAILFSNANMTVRGSITVPSSGTGSFADNGDPTNIAATTVTGAIDEVNDRIPKIYNSAGTLLNP